MNPLKALPFTILLALVASSQAGSPGPLFVEASTMGLRVGARFGAWDGFLFATGSFDGTTYDANRTKGDSVTYDEEWSTGSAQFEVGLGGDRFWSLDSSTRIGLRSEFTWMQPYSTMDASLEHNTDFAVSNRTAFLVGMEFGRLLLGASLGPKVQLHYEHWISRYAADDGRTIRCDNERVNTSVDASAEAFARLAF